jgi:hypothetical protein
VPSAPASTGASSTGSVARPIIRSRAPSRPENFLDDASFTDAYFKEYKRGLGGRQPTVWAFHAYTTGTTGSLGDYRRWDKFRRATSRPDAPDPKIWLTEQGGVVEVNGRVRTEEEARAAANRLFNDLVGKSTRITRFYYYTMVGAPGFDSGLRNYHTQQLRPVFFDYNFKSCPVWP